MSHHHAIAHPPRWPIALSAAGAEYPVQQPQHRPVPSAVAIYLLVFGALPQIAIVVGKTYRLRCFFRVETAGATRRCYVSC